MFLFASSWEHNSRFFYFRLHDLTFECALLVTIVAWKEINRDLSCILMVILSKYWSKCMQDSNFNFLRWFTPWYNLLRYYTSIKRVSAFFVYNKVYFFMWDHLYWLYNLILGCRQPASQPARFFDIYGLWDFELRWVAFFCASFWSEAAVKLLCSFNNSVNKMVKAMECSQ